MNSRSHDWTRSRQHTSATLRAAALALAAAGVVLVLPAAAVPSNDGSDTPARAVAASVIGLRPTTPSHDRTYRITIVSVEGALSPRARQDWTVRLDDALGRPVEGGRLTLEAWLPDGPPGRTRLPPARSLGRGHYRIEGVRFPESGWWNVPVRIEAAAGTDSLALNLVLPGRGGTHGAGAS